MSENKNLILLSKEITVTPCQWEILSKVIKELFEPCARHKATYIVTGWDLSRILKKKFPFYIRFERKKVIDCPQCREEMQLFL